MVPSFDNYEVSKQESPNVWLGMRKEDKVKVKLVLYEKEEYIKKKILFEKLAHPNLEELLDSFQQEGKYWIVTRIPDGKLLEHYYKILHYKLPEELVKTILQQILTGLIHLQMHNIVHRNLCLTTISILAFNEGPKVVIHSFENAKLLEGEEEFSSFWHSDAHFLSPESFDHASEHNLSLALRSADLWAAAVLAFMILFGHFPFGEGLPFANKTALKEAILDGRVEMEADGSISPAARDFFAAVLNEGMESRSNPSKLLEHAFFSKKSARLPGSPVLPKATKDSPLESYIAHRRSSLPATVQSDLRRATFVRKDGSGGSSMPFQKFGMPIESIPEFIPRSPAPLSVGAPSPPISRYTFAEQSAVSLPPSQLSSDYYSRRNSVVDRPDLSYMRNRTGERLPRDYNNRLRRSGTSPRAMFSLSMDNAFLKTLRKPTATPATATSSGSSWGTDFGQLPTSDPRFTEDELKEEREEGERRHSDASDISSSRRF